MSGRGWGGCEGVIDDVFFGQERSGFVSFLGNKQISKSFGIDKRRNSVSDFDSFGPFFSIFIFTLYINTARLSL